MSEHKPSDIEAFIGLLPDPEAARTFLFRLETIAPLTRPDDLLLSRLLTIAAYSPFLAETVLRHPEYISWLKRETEAEFGRVKSAEQLSEELARFITRSIDADERTRLARFKRRELLRIYLRDCLNVATLSEVTEELSNLADVILAHALALALQEMTNRHGSPLTIDDRGRRAQAEMAIVALGKLGCRELNYASDIDLLFLYSGQGNTAGDGRRADSAISNKEFFTSVANRVVQIIGSSAGEGAVYRIDLRLRPYGRDGDTVWETNLAADYYRTKAHAGSVFFFNWTNPLTSSGG
jgi:glutamate-ammonia-ligase adenylyltransferase